MDRENKREKERAVETINEKKWKEVDSVVSSYSHGGPDHTEGPAKIVQVQLTSFSLAFSQPPLRR